MVDEVVVTPQTSNIIANNQAFMQQMADFNRKYVPKPKELPVVFSQQPPATGAIEQSYPEEFFMPDIPILWVVGKFGKAAVKYGVKTAGFGGTFLKSQKVNNFNLTHSGSLITSKSSYKDIKNLSDDDLIQSVMNPLDGQHIVIHSRTGNVIEGNTRLYELQRRGINIDVPYETKIVNDGDYFYDMK